MNVWRINLKPGSANGFDSRTFCIENNIVGIGWAISGETEIKDLKSYVKLWTEKYDKKKDKGWSPAINALASRIKNNDLIWTRDKQGIYYLGQINGEWYYSVKPENIKADIVNIRPCCWYKIGTIESVPGKLVNSFIPSRTVQVVNDRGVNLFSRLLLNKLSNSKIYNIEKFDKNDIFSLLSSDDCEDIIALYLQMLHDFILVPSSCKDDTMNYEYVLINKHSGIKAVVQVKNGHVNLSFDNFKNIDSIIYLFTTKGTISGSIKENMKIIKPEEIKDFIYNNKKILPQKIKEWIDFIDNNG